MLLSHGPGLGDIIYSLAVIKYLWDHEGGEYTLGLRGPLHYCRMFKTALSFIKSQEYIADCVILSKDDLGEFDLDTFRRVPSFAKENIVTTHFRGIGIDDIPTIEPWLTAEVDDRYPIVVHRSPRYHADVDYKFLKDVDAVVLGAEDEAKPFRSKLRWVPTKSFAELAAIINGCKVFIGNQSSPLSVAVGLGKSRLYERYLPIDDCHYPDVGIERSLTNDAKENARLLNYLLDINEGNVDTSPHVEQRQRQS